MKKVRKYGDGPYRVAVVHGGPGALGGLAPLAREIARYRGVLEPIQTGDSVNGQVEELQEVLNSNAEVPAILVGFSWGALLSVITAARYPELVVKLVLVGSAVFEPQYAEGITAERLKRLSEQDRITVLELSQNLETGAQEKVSRIFRLFLETDAYEPLPHYENTNSGFDYHIYRQVWSEAEKMRTGGELLKLASGIRCSVVAIHGNHDPHPAEGVREPLSRVLNDFKFVLLEKCGHDPTIEKYARDRFYAILKDEITGSV